MKAIESKKQHLLWKAHAYTRVKNHGWRNITSRLWFVRQVLERTDISRFYAALCNLAYYMIRNDQIALIFNLYECRSANYRLFMSLLTWEQTRYKFAFLILLIFMMISQLASWDRLSAFYENNLVFELDYSVGKYSYIQKFVDGTNVQNFSV